MAKVRFDIRVPNIVAFSGLNRNPLLAWMAIRGIQGPSGRTCTLSRAEIARRTHLIDPYPYMPKPKQTLTRSRLTEAVDALLEAGYLVKSLAGLRCTIPVDECWCLDVCDQGLCTRDGVSLDASVRKVNTHRSESEHPPSGFRTVSVQKADALPTIRGSRARNPKEAKFKAKGEKPTPSEGSDGVGLAAAAQIFIGWFGEPYRLPLEERAGFLRQIGETVGTAPARLGVWVDVCQLWKSKNWNPVGMTAPIHGAKGRPNILDRFASRVLVPDGADATEEGPNIIGFNPEARLQQLMHQAGIECSQLDRWWFDATQAVQQTMLDQLNTHYAGLDSAGQEALVHDALMFVQANRPVLADLIAATCLNVHADLLNPQVRRLLRVAATGLLLGKLFGGFEAAEANHWTIAENTSANTA